MSPLLPMDSVRSSLREHHPVSAHGRVTRIAGLLIEATLPGARVGMLAELSGGIPAEVVALRDGTCSLMPLGGVSGIAAGAKITSTGESPAIRVGPSVLGRVLDGWGEPIDGLGPLLDRETRMPLDPAPLNPLERGRVDAPLAMGVRVLDGLLTMGAGQRMAILAGAGVGKSTLLGMMCRNTSADVVVIGLVGERGREVKEFVEADLGVEGLRRAVVVVATSDQPGALRLRAAKATFAIAEYFRDRGLKVLLLLDSLSRVAMAQRELGLAIGEPPATKGYPPSAFALIPRLLERAGPGIGGGSITALCTTLLEGDDLGDPVGDAVKATTDGHIVLSRSFADRGHFPAVDVIKSVSRVMSQLVSKEQRVAAQTIRTLLADHHEVEELATLGAYQRGSVPRFDRALNAYPHVASFLRQAVEERVTPKTTIEALARLAQNVGGEGA